MTRGTCSGAILSVAKGNCQWGELSILAAASVNARAQHLAPPVMLRMCFKLSRFFLSCHDYHRKKVFPAFEVHSWPTRSSSLLLVSTPRCMIDHPPIRRPTGRRSFCQLPSAVQLRLLEGLPSSMGLGSSESGRAAGGENLNLNLKP